MLYFELQKYNDDSIGRKPIGKVLDVIYDINDLFYNSYKSVYIEREGKEYRLVYSDKELEKDVLNYKTVCKDYTKIDCHDLFLCIKLNIFTE